MAVKRKSINFLPGIFRSDVNQKFLGSTVDQLINEPELRRIEGFVGRQFIPNFVPSSNYLIEPEVNRQQYQLEPSFVVNVNDKLEFFSDYNDLINGINYNGGITNNHDRLFKSEYYSFDPQIDLDKLVNYSQYYWLPGGPPTVELATRTVSTHTSYTFTSNVSNILTNRTGTTANPTLTLVRGVTYTFIDSAAGNLYIQTESGLSGTELYNPSVSSRSIYGLSGNGSGTLTFVVPSADAQNSILNLQNIDYVDFATANTFTSLDGAAWNANVKIDNDATFPKDKYIIFLNTSTNNADWTTRNASVVPSDQRKGIWQININVTGNIELSYVATVSSNQKVTVKRGDKSGFEYYKPSTEFTRVPEVTAPLTKLYYQSDANAAFKGEINIVDSFGTSGNVIVDIIGETNPTFSGVELSNGMKIKFDDTIEPATYRNKSYIVEGVGISTKLIEFDSLNAVEVETELDTVEYDTDDYDALGFDSVINGSRKPDYITINRASIDQNPWSRSNRWFHIDIIKRSAQLSGLGYTLSSADRAQRPIIEFRPDLQLYKFGRIGLGAVDYLFDENTVLTIQGQTVALDDYSTQINNRKITELADRGVPIINGQRLIFANDNNELVRSTIYQVTYQDQSSAVTFDGNITGNIRSVEGSAAIKGETGISLFAVELKVGSHIYAADNSFLGLVDRIIDNQNLILDRPADTTYNSVGGFKYNTPVVNLVSQQVCQEHASVYVVNGANRKKSFYLTYDSNYQVIWYPGQQKTSINQEPMYDVIDNNVDTSLGQLDQYLDNNFAGTKVFSYTRGSSAEDPVLGFNLSYNSIGNTIGDINFTNDYAVDTFSYVTDLESLTPAVAAVSSGSLRKIISYTVLERVNLWNTVGTDTRQYQHISKFYQGDTNYFELGTNVAVQTGSLTNLRVFVNNKFIPPIKEGAMAQALATTVTGVLASQYSVQINDFYIVYLGRYPEQDGLDYWVNTALSAGINFVENSIRYSAEAINIRNNIKETSIVAPAVPSDSSALAVSLANQVHEIYITFLGRYAEQTELDYWVTTIISNTADLAAVELSIRNSAEATVYKNRFKNYSLETVSNIPTLRIDQNILSMGDRVDIIVYSQSSTGLGYYQIPTNLEFNPQNQEIKEITLGQMRNHLQQIGQNVSNLKGDILGNNNIRDINTKTIPGTLLQHSAPLTYAGLFLNDDRLNLLSSIDLARKDYTRFKNKFLELAVNSPEIDFTNIANAVDQIINKINAVKTAEFSWYYSDMLPCGDKYKQSIYKITSVVPALPISQVFSNSEPSNRAILVYLNNQQLVYGKDYTFDTIGPIVRISATLQINDTVVIREYSNTDGSFIPETPTKLGLHPKFIPEKYLDNTYRTSAYVIQGHDGSLTPAFNDYRDNLLLELETRIYNNIKADFSKTLLNLYSIIPGKFRSTAYSNTEFNRVLNTELLKWIGNNRLDYASNNTFLGNDEFTWNYRSAKGKDNQRVPGFWRGIYKYYFDTDRPHTHPWEMLGYWSKPTWWDTYYSWTDPTKRTALILAVTNGYRLQPPSTVAYSSFARTNFAAICPVDTNGNLRSPMRSVIGMYNSEYFSRNWSIGDHGPVESAWRRTSDYVFSLQRCLALMFPGFYFGTLFDVSRYYKNTQINQYMYNTNGLRQGTSAVVVNGEQVGNIVTRASGYINWVHGYLTNLGINAAATLRQYLNNLSVNLSYKMAGYTDKKYLTVLAFQSSPDSVNESIIIPDENYQIHLYKSLPIRKAVYSAVIVQKTGTGYSVTGYNVKYPYFTIIPSNPTGSSYKISVLGTEAMIFEEYRAEKVSVPYGYEFENAQQVIDFLMGYQRFLIAQGFVFDNYDNDLGSIRDWTLSAKEFLTWVSQGWQQDNIIVLSPAVDTLNLISLDSFVDELTGKVNDSRLLGVNFNVLRNNEFSLVRDGNNTKLFTISGQSIGFVDLNLVQYENIVIFDNVTVFNDIIYKPDLGNRQFRLKLVGSKTDNWDGQLNIPGFIYNNGSLPTWQAGQDYKKGDLVTYKSKNYTAIGDVSAAGSFDFKSWAILDIVPEEKLMPNFATNAGKLDNFYDVDQPPSQEDLAKFSAGLIGYRSRSYLEDLGMNFISQVKFYQGFIKEKGTINTINALSRGQFDYNSEIEVYEDWAARMGEYGAIDANPELHIVLNETNFKNNPLGIELVTATGSASGNLVIAVTPDQVAIKPLDYVPDVFVNRNVQVDKTWTIELFGDGIMCGRNPYYIPSDLLFLSCANGDRVTGRVTTPPDSLLYNTLSSTRQVAVTTRSLENSNTNMLLAGAPGSNAAWPDDIEADIVVINHGIGDARAGIDVDVYKNNLRSLRRKLKPHQIVIWVTPTQIDTTNISAQFENIGGRTDIVSYVNKMKEVALEFNDIVADAYAIPNWIDYLKNPYGITSDISSINSGQTVNFSVTGDNNTETVYYSLQDIGLVVPRLGDGIHPNQLGYNLLVNTVIAPAIETAINNRLKSSLKDYEDDLMTAGYVNYDEVDTLIFDISNYDQIPAEVTDVISSGYKIWVAKDFNHDWQVYRAYKQNLTIDQVVADLDNKIVFRASGNIDIAVGDLFAVNNIDINVNGFYQAYLVDGTDVTVIADDDTYNYVRGAVIAAQGNFFDFTPMRYSTIAARDQAKLNTRFFTGDKVYVDDIGDNLASWAVYDVIEDSFYTIKSNVTSFSYGQTIGFDLASPFDSDTVFYSLANLNTVSYTANDAWTLVRSQNVKVDIDSVNNLYLYSDKRKEILTRLDLFDPVKGRILSVARQDIDYTTSIDPAQYNTGNDSVLPIANDLYWGSNHLGQYWWDMDACRFMDYERNAIDFRIDNWGKLFPGSSIDVYQWIESDVPPSQYQAAGYQGQPKYSLDQAYSTESYVDSDTNVVTVKYYYWVKGLEQRLLSSKINTTNAVESIILNPAAQGIAYAAIIKQNALALYNVGSYLEGTDTILYLSYKKDLSQRIIHSEYRLVQAESEKIDLPARIENKIIDSLSGRDLAGRNVPDPLLNDIEKIGLSLRPRQTAIVNRRTALENVIKYVNSILIDQAISSRIYNNKNIYSSNFYAADPIPAASEYDEVVNSYAGDPDSNLSAVIKTNNLKVLVLKNEYVNNYWTIYQYNSSTDKWVLIRRQVFDVTKFWNFVDWYAPGYSSNTIPTYSVDQYRDIEKLVLQDGDTVKVRNLVRETLDTVYLGSTEVIGNFELYKFSTVNNQLTKKLVGLQHGTIQIADILYQQWGFGSETFDIQGFDFDIAQEFRYIYAGLKNDVFVGDLTHYSNTVLFFVIDYILSEQKYIDWFFKTSFINVIHKVKGLLQVPSYIKDRQNVYESYINEIKPYRTKIRNYKIVYDEIETQRFKITDFDLPSSYDATLDIFRSPNGDLIGDDYRLTSARYIDWAENYRYQVGSVDIAQSGYGYHDSQNQAEAPDIKVIRTDDQFGTDATVTGLMKPETQSISKVYVTSNGSNYTQTPKIQVIGNGATDYNDLLRYDFRVTARGLSDTSAVVWGLFNAKTNAAIYTSSARSYTMHRIRRVDGVLVFTKQYDIYGETAPGFTGNNSLNLAEDLEATTSDYIVVVHTYNEPALNRTNSLLLSAMYRCGASAEIFGSNDFKTQAAYILVGIPGCGRGQGIEVYSGATNNATTAAAELTFRLQQGRLVALSVSPKVLDISGTAVPFVDNQYLNSLSLDIIPRAAKLVPRLVNNSIRKIRTTLRFDRVGYTSQVQDYMPMGFDANPYAYSSDNPYLGQEQFSASFSAGDYVSYRGEAYQVLNNINVGVNPDFSNLRIVGSEQPSTSTKYLNGFFDNANDRIMAYYQPTDSMVPKVLERLVFGINPNRIFTSTKTDDYNDTILTGDTFSSPSGISPGNITVSGGNFVNALFNRAPEELLPGQCFDSYCIRVKINSAITSSNISGVSYAANVSATDFTIFTDILGATTYHNCAVNNKTTLAQPLNLTDANVVVVDGSVLPGSPGGVEPAVIYVNGERISYRTRNGNVLSNIRRGYGGTGSAKVHPAGSVVEDHSLTTVINILKV